jgi:hypothetical protein
MLAKLTCSDDNPDEHSDDLLGFLFTRTSFRRVMRRAFRRPSLYACKTDTFGRQSKRAFGRPSRVPLHTYPIRTSDDTSLQTTVSVCLQNSLVQMRNRTPLQTSLQMTRLLPISANLCKLQFFFFFLIF